MPRFRQLYEVHGYETMKLLVRNINQPDMVAPRCTEFYRYGKQYKRALQKGLLLERTHIQVNYSRNYSTKNSITFTGCCAIVVG